MTTFRRTIETNRLIRSNVRRPRRLSSKDTIDAFSSCFPFLSIVTLYPFAIHRIDCVAGFRGMSFTGWKSRIRKSESSATFPIGRQTHSRLNILKTTAPPPFQRTTYNRSSSNRRSLWRFCRIARIDGADLRPCKIPLSIDDRNNECFFLMLSNQEWLSEWKRSQKHRCM